MSKREPIKTTIQEAVEYWSKREDECGLSVDWSEAETHCWRCGCENNLQCCHIVPDALDGKDEPANIVLLCSRCHAEGPNVSDPEIMWDWIRAYGVPFYETFWVLMAMKEYKFIYHKSIEDEIKDILSRAGKSICKKEINELIIKSSQLIDEQASVHFGQSYFNTATMAGLYRIMLKNIAKSVEACFPLKDNCEN